MGRFSENIENDETNADIDMSPLIDCVFILLIFFIVTTVFVTETEVETDRPLVMTADRLERNSVLIAITVEDEVIFGGRDIGVAGVQPLIKRMLKDEQLPVILLPDAGAKSSTVIRVQNEAKLGGAATIHWAARTAS
ncbi:MAG: biopolymer transporter ExbD [Phycisphaeraceae bacterium]|nr:biopolymer transporter ExbD [Phycisphaeraceae bacterium]